MHVATRIYADYVEESSCVCVTRRQLMTSHTGRCLIYSLPLQWLFAGRYYVAVAPCDVQAVLENHTHIEDIDISRLPLLASAHPDNSLEPPRTPEKADSG